MVVQFFPKTTVPYNNALCIYMQFFIQNEHKMRPMWPVQAVNSKPVLGASWELQVDLQLVTLLSAS